MYNWVDWENEERNSPGNLVGSDVSCSFDLFTSIMWNVELKRKNKLAFTK